MVQSFKSFLTLRIGALICILVVASFAFYLSRADTIENDLRTERAQTLGNTLAQRLEKKRDVGITNAISMAAGGNMADLVAYGQRDRAEAELKRIGDVFKARSNFQGIKIQLFNSDFSVLLRNWKPQSYGDTSVPVLPLLKKVASSGKAEADFVVDKDGFFLRGTAPLTRNGKDVGFLQFLQGVGSVSRDFEKEGTSYALLLTPEVAANSPSISKAPRYGQLFLAKKAWFSEKVRNALGSLDVESLIRSGDILDNANFAVAIPLDDFTGKRIGYHILIEPETRLAAKIDAATSTARIFIVIMALGFLLMGVLILFMLNRTLLRPMHSLAGYAQTVAEGDMEKEFTTPTRYELKTLAETILTMIRGLQERTEHAQEQAEQARIKGREARESLEKANREEQHISQLFASLKEASAKAEDISHKALSAVNDLSGEVDLVTRGVEVQRDRMMETATAMEEMNSTVAEVARNASDAALNAASSREKATTGAEGVHSAVESIGHIETRIHKLKDTMTQLGEQASSIGTVLGVITEIADQTNLLALNAAIEAARAGEAGRGFAVVADEVRKLAEKTMDATKEVESVIISIQDSAKDNVRAVEAAAEDITRSTEASNEAGRFMQEIVAIVEETSLQVDSIATASEEQSATSEEINRAVSDVNSIAAESAQGMQRSAENLASITALVGELDATIQKIAAGETEDAASGDLMTWSDKLSVGINSIDAQHKKLVQMINDLNRAMKDKRSRETLIRIVEELGEYVVTHFSYEEKLFDKHGYPDTDSHKAIHKEFVDKVKEFGEELATGRTTVSLDVLKFLKDWLVEHIMGTDKEYGPFLQKHGVR